MGKVYPVDAILIQRVQRTHLKAAATAYTLAIAQTHGDAPFQPFGVMTPTASQGATLEKHSRANSWSIVQAEALNIENDSLHLPSAHSFLVVQGNVISVFIMSESQGIIDNSLSGVEAETVDADESKSLGHLQHLRLLPGGVLGHNVIL